MPSTNNDFKEGAILISSSMSKSPKSTIYNPKPSFPFAYNKVFPPSSSPISKAKVYETTEATHYGLYK